MADWNIEKINEFVEINGEGDKLISNLYKNAHAKLTFLCHICNREFDMVWSSYRKGHRHSVCSWRRGNESRKYKFEDVKQYIESFGYLLLSEKYEYAESKMAMICPGNHHIEMTYSSFLEGHRCYKCFHIRLEDKRRFDLNYVRKYIEDNGNGDILNSNEYKNAFTKIIVKCFSCKENYFSSIAKFSCGYRCPKCAPKKWRKTQLENQFLKGNTFAEKRPELLDEWDWEKNVEDPCRIAPCSKIKVFWICKKCNRPFLSAVNNRSSNNGTSCPFCNESKMEKNVSKILLGNKILFTPQKKFTDCRNKRQLPFDFFLDDFNIIIETHGIQHYENVEVFGGEEGFKIRKENDLIKEKYCKDNNIIMIIIPYWEKKNILQILTQELNIKRKEENLIG